MTTAIITLAVALVGLVALLATTMVLWRSDLRALDAQRDKRAQAERERAEQTLRAVRAEQSAADQTARAINAEHKYTVAAQAAARHAKELESRDTQIARTGPLADVVHTLGVQLASALSDDTRPGTDPEPTTRIGVPVAATPRTPGPDTRGDQ